MNYRSMTTVVVLFAVLFSTLTSHAAEIVWVHQSRGASWEDDQWRALLEENGHTIVDNDRFDDLDTNPGGIDLLNSADLVIFSRDSNSGDYNGPAEQLAWTEEITVPMIVMTPFVLRSTRWQMVDSAAIVVASQPLEAVDLTHPIFNGVALDADGQVEVWDSDLLGPDDNINLIETTDVGDGLLIAQEASTGNPWIVLWEEGAEFYDGSAYFAGGPRLFFSGGSDDDPNTWGNKNITPAGDQMFLNAIDFLVASEDFFINGGGETYRQDFDEMGTGKRMPKGWSGVTDSGSSRRIAGLGLTDGFLTVPGNPADGVLGVLNLGGNAESFGPAPDGFVPTWTAELGGDNNLFGRDDVIVDNASDRALGVSRENNDSAGELNFEVEIVGATMRSFVFDWDLEIWGGDPDGVFRSPEGPGMKVDLKVGGTTYYEETKNLLPGAKFDSAEDQSGSDHNATLIDGNAYSVRGMTSGIKEVSGADGAVGNFVQVNFNSNWNDATDGDANGWISAVDNVRLRALAPGDADANGVVDVADLLTLLGGQKFNQGVDGVTWEQGDFNADDQFNTGDLLAMLSFLSGTFPSDPYASEAGGASDAVADIIVNSETGEVTVDLAGHTVSAIIIESAAEIFNGVQPQWDTTSQFPSTLPGELGNVLFTSTAAGVDELGAVISAEFLGRDKEFYLQDLDLNILIASEGGALTKGNVIVVPEPSTWMMLGLGSLLLVGWRQGAKRRSPGKK